MPAIPTTDLIALAWFLACAYGYGFLSRYGPLSRRGIMVEVQNQRREWMLNMAVRDIRLLDVQLLSQLQSGNAFFASTSVIVVGGLAAIMGSGGELQRIVEQWPLIPDSTPFLWQMKTLFLMALFVTAFFKFAWGYRLTHYTAIMIGAAPIPEANLQREDIDEVGRNHAERTARLAGIAAEHANSGLRTYYFAIAGIGWYVHPFVFMAASAWVVMIVYRREYHSRALAAIANR